MWGDPESPLQQPVSSCPRSNSFCPHPDHHLCTPLPRLQKILSESPPPARLDIQLPIISDDFKFQVWKKMFRALMPGTESGGSGFG